MTTPRSELRRFVAMEPAEAALRIYALELEVQAYSEALREIIDRAEAAQYDVSQDYFSAWSSAAEIAERALRDDLSRTQESS